MSSACCIQIGMNRQEVIGMTEEKKVAKVPHSLIVENRCALTATGVSNVDSFDEQTIVAYTDLGELIIRGSHLNQ
jgi:hypothetical protein